MLQSAITNRGYTGHEEITEVNLIHMNGRVYDQQLGRFLSADPHIQAPYLVNSFNRYSYVMNNPLKYTDPTGFFWSEVGEAISSAWSSVTSFFSGGSSSNNGHNSSNSSSSNNQKNLKGDGLGFTIGYIGRAIGSWFGGSGNTEADVIKMGAITAETQCRSGNCGESQLRRLGIAADKFGRDSCFNRSWNYWADRTTKGKVYSTASLNYEAFVKERLAWFRKGYTIELGFSFIATSSLIALYSPIRANLPDMGLEVTAAFSYGVNGFSLGFTKSNLAVAGGAGYGFGTSVTLTEGELSSLAGTSSGYFMDTLVGVESSYSSGGAYSLDLSFGAQFGAGGILKNTTAFEVFNVNDGDFSFSMKRFDSGCSQLVH